LHKYYNESNIAPRITQYNQGKLKLGSCSGNSQGGKSS